MEKAEKTQEQRESRERILGAAEHIFAEKGFDGARVDEIAQRAGVNKALIYYYFKGKEEILDVLFKKLIDEVVNLVDFSKIEGIFSEPEEIRGILRKYILYLEDHDMLLRIFLMESLKEGAKALFTGQFFKYVLHYEQEAMKAFGVRMGDSQEMLVLDFFTAVMPMTGYVVFRKLWAKQFGVTEDELRENFLTSFIDTHIACTIDIVKRQIDGPSP